MDRKHLVTVIFLLGTLFLSACVTPLHPVPPGTTHLESSTHGLVFGRIAITGNVCLQMSQSCGMDFGWWMKREDSGEYFVVNKLTKDGPFALSLPAGTYRVSAIMFRDCGGVMWHGKLPATFTVNAGEAVYLGTWTIRFLADGLTARTHVVDNFTEERQELAKTYIGPPLPMAAALLKSAPEGYFAGEERRD